VPGPTTVTLLQFSAAHSSLLAAGQAKYEAHQGPNTRQHHCRCQVPMVNR
jgi:hypothetical protein